MLPLCSEDVSNYFWEETAKYNKLELKKVINDIKCPEIHIRINIMTTMDVIFWSTHKHGDMSLQSIFRVVLFIT